MAADATVVAPPLIGAWTGSRPRLRHPLEWGVIAVDQALHLSVLVLLAVALTA